ncbi:hypothetical protein D3C84_1201170 [compost metagenome]
MVSIGWLLQLIISALAVYMRAHKREPLVTVSFVNGVYVGGATLLASVYLPFNYFFAGFLSAYLLVVPWVVVIFKRNKRISL